MICRNCRREVVFVEDVVQGRKRVQAFHAPINVCDRDLFSPGARLTWPPASTRYRLRRELEQECLR
jgi:hypothetical protein